MHISGVGLLPTRLKKTANKNLQGCLFKQKTTPLKRAMDSLKLQQTRTVSFRGTKTGIYDSKLIDKENERTLERFDNGEIDEDTARNALVTSSMDIITAVTHRKFRNTDLGDEFFQWSITHERGLMRVARDFLRIPKEERDSRELEFAKHAWVSLKRNAQAFFEQELGDKPLSLDFVYGDAGDGSTLLDHLVDTSQERPDIEAVWQDVNPTESNSAVEGADHLLEVHRTPQMDTNETNLLVEIKATAGDNRDNSDLPEEWKLAITKLLPHHRKLIELGVLSENSPVDIADLLNDDRQALRSFGKKFTVGRVSRELKKAKRILEKEMEKLDDPRNEGMHGSSVTPKMLFQTMASKKYYWDALKEQERDVLKQSYFIGITREVQVKKR